MEYEKLTTWGKIAKLYPLQGIEEQQQEFMQGIEKIISDMQRSGHVTHKKAVSELIDRQSAYLKRLSIEAFGPAGEPGGHSGRGLFQIDSGWPV